MDCAQSDRTLRTVRNKAPMIWIALAFKNRSLDILTPVDDTLTSVIGKNLNVSNISYGFGCLEVLA